MARKKWILILTVFMAVTQQQIDAACVCNAKGEDACATCSGTVRPKPNHPKRPEFELPPVGDNCWCSKTLIEPASLPKPCSKTQNGTPTCGSPALPLSPSYVVPEVNYVQALVKDNSPPADPISVSLALQAGKAIEVPEAKLSYGFLRKPINRLPKVFISSIKEEDLYALANDVIILKKPTRTAVKKLEEEDYPEPEEEEPAQEDYQPPSLTYKQLGYAAEEFANPEFIPIPYYAEPDAALTDDKEKMNCGFKPGRIAKLNQNRKCGAINYFMKH